jgi:protein gp37
MTKTKIPWATDVWNPTVGCTKLSAGCKNCYAERIFERFNPGQKFSEVHCYPERLDQPLHWKKSRRVFVDSMSDLFHEDVPSLFIDHVFETMHLAYWHTFMILTKRAERMYSYISQRYLPNRLAVLPNVWLGVTTEDQKTADGRIPFLLQTPAAIRFVSVEPMLEKINISPYLYGNIGRYYGDHPNYLNWVICGCESGPGARPMKMSWAADMKHQCVFYDVPFFFKQAMIKGKLVKMPVIDGKIWDEIPLKSNKNG